MKPCILFVLFPAIEVIFAARRCWFRFIRRYTRSRKPVWQYCAYVSGIPTSGDRTALRILSMTQACTKHVINSSFDADWPKLFYLTHCPWVKCHLFASHIGNPEKRYPEKSDLLLCDSNSDQHDKTIQKYFWVTSPWRISLQAARMHPLIAKEILWPSAWSEVSASEVLLSCCIAASRNIAAGLFQGRLIYTWYSNGTMYRVSISTCIRLSRGEREGKKQTLPPSNR